MRNPFDAIAQMANPNIAAFAKPAAEFSRTTVIVTQLQLVYAHTALAWRTHWRPRVQLPQLANGCHLRALTRATRGGAVDFCAHLC